VKLENAPQTTTENTVSVVKRDGAWYIQDVLGKKTSIDFILGDEIKPGQSGSDPGPSEEAPAEDTAAPEEGAPAPATP
jgi:hypothetical protein